MAGPSMAMSSPAGIGSPVFSSHTSETLTISADAETLDPRGLATLYAEQGSVHSVMSLGDTDWLTAEWKATIPPTPPLSLGFPRSRCLDFSHFSPHMASVHAGGTSAATHRPRAQSWPSRRQAFDGSHSRGSQISSSCRRHDDIGLMGS
jgi:hypothetical protein